MAVVAPSQHKKLEGKVAIITGGASGIGEATAHVFAEHGARVVIADIQDELGQDVAKSIGGDCMYMHCDVADENQVKALVGRTVQIYGQLDIMFSNAGTLSSCDQVILDLDMSQLDRLFGVDICGNVACVKHAARAMVDGRIRGTIVCNASVAARIGGDKRTDYFMAKHAIVGLVKSASKQLGNNGIRVNSVSPFMVLTPLMRMAYNYEKNDEEIEKMYQPLTSLKDVVLKAKHVADAVLFLVSDDSAFLTGHDLVVDGGFTT